MPATQLFELTPAESVFAPFNDPAIAPQLPFRLMPRDAVGVRHKYNWDSTHLTWENCPAGAVAAVAEVAVHELPARFDQLVFCVVAPTTVRIQFEIGCGDRWTPLGEPVSGIGRRLEVARDITVRPFDAVRAIFTADPGQVSLSLQWWGAAESALVRSLIAARPRYDGRWEGLILPPEQWPAVKFARGLLFAEGDLPALRARMTLPGWAEQAALLEERARKCLARRPEDDIDGFLPQTDLRYIRAREHGRATYFTEPIITGFVGLLCDDRALSFHALRYLMSILHTPCWAQSAESRARGSVWDQRCFNEEMVLTAATLLLDWYDFALTPRARALAQQALWDKGVATIERDMMKFDYVFTMNQGPWFCRARILAGLYLETVWPRMKPHTDLAAADMKAGMENYVMADGGTDEGLGYFAVTLHAVLLGAVAYARARGVDARTLLPPAMAETGRFVSILSAMEPGRVLMDGDNSIDVIVGDSIPILATLYPDAVYRQLAAACLSKRRAPSYFDQYITEGVFAFILGPEKLETPQPVVPTFGRLPHTGHLTSLRRNAAGRSVRLHLAGAKALASHTHFDKGCFTLELDRLPVLLDRGQVRYDDLRSYTLKRTELHNVLTPVLPGEIFPNQLPVEAAVIPEGEGDDRVLRARIDLSSVWRGIMRSCTRELAADSFNEFTVTDAGELPAPGTLSFHLQTRVPWEISGREAVLRVPGWEVRVSLPWADTLTQREDSIDFEFQPVWHFEARVASPAQFRLVTQFTCTPR